MLPEVEEIRRKRKSLGLTQKELATISGVSQSLIAKIESKKVNPSYAVVKRIFDSLERMEDEIRITAEKLLSSHVIFVKRSDRVEKAIKLMREHGYSQLPVFEGGRPVGSVSERMILDFISKGEELHELLRKKVGEVMEDPFPVIAEKEPLSTILALLKNNHAILVSRKGRIVGIITKADLFKVANATS